MSICRIPLLFNARAFLSVNSFKGGWHLHDSVARIGMTRVVPVRKLVVNWREVCVNPSWLRAMLGREFWNVQNFGHDKFRDRVVNYAQTVRELVGTMREVRKLCANYAWTIRELVACMAKTVEPVTCDGSLRVRAPKWHDMPRQNRGQKSCKCQLGLRLFLLMVQIYVNKGLWFLSSFYEGLNQREKKLFYKKNIVWPS